MSRLQTKSADPLREKDVRIDWIIGALNRIIATFDQPVRCGNSACGKTYTPREGLNLESMMLCCPHCNGGEEQPGGISIAWTGEGMTCGRCKRRVPVKVEFFYKNAGFLFFRWTDEVGGARCRKCIDGDFWEGVIISGLFGWFGIVSLPLNPFLLGINCIRYLRTIGMKETLTTTEIDGPTRMRIADDLPNVYQDLARNTSHPAACANAGKRLNVSPIDVRLALQESIRRQVADRLRIESGD